MLRRLISVVLLLLPLTVAQGQRRSSIEITLPPAALLARDAPAVSTSGVLAGDEEEALVRKGFAARLRFVAELWPERELFGNAGPPRAEWNVIVKFEPLEKVFEVVRIAADGSHFLGRFEHFADVRVVLARPYQPLLRAPDRAGSYYYTAVLEVERMSANDLAEMKSWMNGDLRPAIRSESNPGTAVFRGLGAIFSRLIGAGKKKYRAQSETFRVA